MGINFQIIFMTFLLCRAVGSLFPGQMGTRIRIPGKTADVDVAAMILVSFFIPC